MTTIQERIDKSRQLLKDRKVPEAEKQLRKAVEQDPASTLAKVELLKLLALLKKWNDYEKLIEEAMVTDGEDAEVLTLKGVNLSRQKQYSQSIVYYQQALDKNPDSVMALTNLGIALRETGKASEAEDVLQKGLKIDSQNFHLHYELAQTLARQMRIDSAIYEILETLKLNPKHEPAYLALAQIYQQTGNIDQGIEILKQCLTNIPTSEEAAIMVKDFLILKGDFKNAYGLWEQVALQRGLMSDHIELSRICLAANDVASAEKVLLRAANLSPNSWQPPCFLGELYDMAGVADKALEKHKLAIKLSKGIAYEPHNGFGLHLLKKGNVEGAISQLSQACKLAPANDPKPIYNLALALCRASRAGEARSVLEKALKGAPQEGFFLEMQRLLNTLNSQAQAPAPSA